MLSPVPEPFLFDPPVCLYVHVPFCETKCSYCAFNSFGRSLWDESLVDRYLDALIAEMGLRSTTDPLETIYIGGGTPSVLEVPALERLLRAIRSIFATGSLKEWTMEMNPGNAHDEKILAAREHGVNRVSLGAQTMDRGRLKSIGRIHEPEDVERSVDAIRRAGIDNFNLDLIYGLPDQGLGGFVDDLAAIMAFGSPHLSLYNLQFEEETELHAKMTRGEVAPEDEEVQLGMYSEAVGRCAAAGIEQYEISNFARRGHESKHNQNYWRNGSYIGVGAGAWGCTGDHRYRNAKEISRYINLVQAGGLPAMESDLLGVDDVLAESMLTGLRTREGVSADELRRRTGIDVNERYRDEIKELLDRGLATQRGERLALTTAGILVSDTVFGMFVN